MPSLNIQERVMFYAEHSTFAPVLLQAHKIADASGRRTSRYVPGLLAGGAVALLAYGCFVLRMACRHGGVALSPAWYFMYIDVHRYCGTVAEMSNLDGPSCVARLALLKGSVVVWLLMSAHRTLPWWPVHRRGYLMASGYTYRVTWPGLLIGWSVWPVVCAVAPLLASAAGSDGGHARRTMGGVRALEPNHQDAGDRQEELTR